MLAGLKSRAIDENVPSMVVGHAPKKMVQNPLDVIREYTRETTVHGVRYVSREGAGILDRLCWVTAIVVCASFAGVYVNSVWVKFLNSPTVTSVSTTHYPLYHIPFPAVTVCSTNRIRKRIGEAILARHLGLGEMNETMKNELWHVMSALSLMQFPFYYRMEEHVNVVKQLLPRFDNFNISSFMIQSMPQCQDLFNSCFWYGSRKNCCQIFHLQRSELGFCYSFNSLTSEGTKHCPSWTVLEADGVEETTQDYPECVLRRNTGAGTTTGLEVFLNPGSKEDHMGPGQKDGNGSRLFVHHPSEFPEASKGLLMPERTGEVYTMKVSASLTLSTAAVRNLLPQERQCYFPDERQLGFYNTYTQQACYMECRIKHVADKCNCTPYFIDRLPGGIPSCKLSQLWCLAFINLDLRSFSPPPGTPGFDTIYSLNCSDCLPSCHETTYTVDASLSDNYNSQLTRAKGYLDVYYKDLGAVKYTKDIAFGRMQLLVSFGGIVGLFLGVSLLSGVELVYYCLKLVVAVVQWTKRGSSHHLPVPGTTRPRPDREVEQDLSPGKHWEPRGELTGVSVADSRQPWPSTKWTMPGRLWVAAPAEVPLKRTLL